MTKALILGASGQIARHVTSMLANQASIEMTLFARDTKRVGSIPDNATAVRGDVLDAAQLRDAVRGQDIVYANLTGADLDAQARNIIAAMQASGVKRLIFVLALGIYDELPGKFGAWNRAMIGEDLKPFRRAADLIDAAGLEPTLLRPAWLTDADEVDYELTRRDEAFKGTIVSRRSVADLIASIILAPDLHKHADLGVSKPGTDGDKPYFM